MFCCFIFYCFSDPFKKISESARAWIIFIISFISSFQIVKVVFPEPNISLCIPASAAAVNPKGIKTLVANGLIAFFINGNRVFNNNGPSNLPKNPPDWTILEIRALESLKSVDVLLLKVFLTLIFCLDVVNYFH